MRLSNRPRLIVAASFLSLLMPAAVVVAQTPAGQDAYTASDQAQDLRDFEHYVMIARPDLAEAHLERLLNSGISDAELAELVREHMSDERFHQVVSRARVVEGMGDVIAQLQSRVTAGILNSSRDPQRISDAIAMLDGTLRQQRFGEEVLLEAGEYGVPYLLAYVTGGDNPTIRQRCVDLLERLESVAVYPLSVAVSQLDSQNQVRIINVLGRISHTGAGPYLAALANDSSAEASVREAANRTASRLGSDPNDLSTNFTSLARRYLESPVSLTAYPDEDRNNVWSYDAAAGTLLPTPVPTEIFGDVLAMALSRRALRHDESNSAALATFIAANLKRENDLPEGDSDPVYGDSQFTPEFYALGSGPSVMEKVLDTALRMGDTPLIRDAIAALQKTAGEGNLVAGSSPLLRALQYPDRRVRYDAALALGKALPASNFAGDFSVVPLLAEAVRAGGNRYALVVATESEDQSTYADWLSSMGYQVVAQVANVGEARNIIEMSSGVDVVIVKQSPDNVEGTVNDLGRSARTSVAPVVVLVPEIDAAALRSRYADTSNVIIKTEARSEEAFGNIVNDAIARASGGAMDEGDAMAYSLEAIGTLNDIAIAKNSVYSIRDAESALIDALQEKEGSIRLAIADVLAHIDSDAAQRALFNAALSASDSAQVDLLKRVADSAKRWGDRAEERHVSQLLALVQRGGEVGEAAARVHGALNLSADNVVKIIAD